MHGTTTTHLKSALYLTGFGLSLPEAIMCISSHLPEEEQIPFKEAILEQAAPTGNVYAIFPGLFEGFCLPEDAVRLL